MSKLNEKDNEENVNSYKEALEKWNIIMKEYRNQIDKMIANDTLKIAMDAVIEKIERIKPKNDVINELIISTDYFRKIINEVYNKDLLMNTAYKLNEQIQSIDLISKNKYFGDTINLCIQEILNSSIKLKTIYCNKDIWSLETFSVLNEFSEDDKENVLDDVKKIVDIAKKEEKNIEQKINEQYKKITEKYPITIGIILFIIHALFESFTEEPKNIYNYNYYYNTTINNNFTNDTSQEFFDNARFVVANKLNLREGPDKSYKVISVLEQGMIVKVIDKVKHWTRIEYINKEDNIQVKGWVYTRYLKAFDIDSLINN